jgi:hypothetical protein
MILPNFLAPASTLNPRLTFNLINYYKRRRVVVMENRAFLSFQISKTLSKVKDAKALRWGVARLARRFHHSMLRPAHCLGWIPWSPIH